MSQDKPPVNVNSVNAGTAVVGNNTFNAPVTIAQSPSPSAPPSRPPPTDNLVAASALRNNNFIGRTKQLDDLASRINAADGPTAVVIVAGAGFGKTELAKHFVNVRAKAAPASADHATLAADQWTARWWLDGSNTGEAASLKTHFQAITGQPFPAEPRPAPGEDPEKVAAAFRTALRKAVAAACSTGRQLLVIDNAETPQQISEYKPGNAGRLIATTRRQPIPSAIGHEFPLDVMSAKESRELLAHARPDLQAPAHAAALDAIATHLGHHALALAYAAAALARRPFKSPQAVLASMQAADVGAEGDILAEFDEAALGTQYKLGLAQSLRLLLDELADPARPTHDALAMDLAGLAAFCAPSVIPVGLLVAASGQSEAAAERSLRALHERSIITLADTVSVHRLTQSLLRGTLSRDGDEQKQLALFRLLDVLLGVFEDTTWNELAPLRTAILPHVEAAIAHWDQSVRVAGEEAAARLPRTPTPAASDAAMAIASAVAHLQGTVAVHLWLIGESDAAERYINAAIGWSDAQSPRDERSAAGWYSARARIRQDRGDLRGANSDIGKSVAWAEAQPPGEERTLAVLYASRASIRQDRGDLKGAEEDIERSIVWAESQSPRDERGLSILYHSRARIRTALGLLQEAEEDIARSFSWAEKQSPRDERTLAILYGLRANIREQRGQLGAAVEDVGKSIAWGEDQTPRDWRGLSLDYALRSQIRQSMGLPAAALEDIERVIGWEQSRDEPNQRQLAYAYAQRASVRCHLGLLNGAQDDIARALNWGLAQSPRDEGTLAAWYATRAKVFHALGLHKNAEEDVTRAIDWQESQRPMNDRGVVFLYEHRAVLLALQRRFAEAEVEIEKALQLELAIFGSDHPFTQLTIRRKNAIQEGRIPE